jgi:hypothetical protein
VEVDADDTGHQYDVAMQIGAGSAIRVREDRATATTPKASALGERAKALGPLSRLERLAVWVVLGAVTALLLWSRLSRLDTSLWHDEVYTISNYIDRGPLSMLFGDYTPNNHMLFSLLSWATTREFGHFEAVYRVWSVMPALAAVALVGWWAWRRLGAVAAVTVVVLTTMSPVHHALAPQVRGYGLGFLAGAGMLVAAARSADRRQNADLALFAVSALVGIWTFPTMAAFFLGHCGVLFAARRDLRKGVLVLSGVVAAASLLFYVGVLGQLVRSSKTDFGPLPLPWHGWVSAPVNDLARPTLDAFFPSRITSAPLVTSVCCALGALGIVRLWRLRDRVLLLQLVVPLVVTYVVFVIGRFWFEPRYGSFLLFQVLVLLAVGVVELWALARRVPMLRVIAVGMLAATTLIGARGVVNDTRRLPYENFQLVAEIVRGSAISRIVTNSARPDGLQYYLGSSRVRVLLRRQVALLCFAPGPFVFVQHNGFGALVPDPACLQQRGAMRVHVTQTIRGSIDIWLVP